jgi:hypothetical protein
VGFSTTLEIILPTITLRKKDGSEIETVKSHIVVVTAGSVTHALHLHKLTDGQWAVSDPRTGGKICYVEGRYKGVPCSSRGLAMRDAKRIAFIQVEALIERIGSDRFNAVLAA